MDLLFHPVEVVHLNSGEALVGVSVEVLVLNVLNVVDSMLVNAGELIQ